MQTPDAKQRQGDAEGAGVSEIDPAKPILPYTTRSPTPPPRPLWYVIFHALGRVALGIVAGVVIAYLLLVLIVIVVRSLS